MFVCNIKTNAGEKMKITTAIKGFISAGVTAGMVATYFTAPENAYANTSSNEDFEMGVELSDKSLNCMAKNIYFEARSESDEGQKAVAWVTLNRVNDTKYPDTVCGVVYQAKKDSSGNLIRHKCQFSWYCDGKSDKIVDKKAWAKAKAIAINVADMYHKEYDPTSGAIMYHVETVKPYWRTAYAQTTQIEAHIFYAYK